MEYFPLVYAVSGSDTPAYSYDYEGVMGVLGDKSANADASTGKCETYAYVYAGNCVAYAAVFAYQTTTGSYRWYVEVDVDLTAYTVNVGIWSMSQLRIRIILLDASYNVVSYSTEWNQITYADDSEDLTFEDTITFTEAFTSYYSNVRYVGVELYISVWSGGKICQDASHTSNSYPAYIEVPEIRWSSY